MVSCLGSGSGAGTRRGQMSERQIRNVLEQICHELKYGVRKGAVPAAVGMGLALASCIGAGMTPAVFCMVS